MNKITLDPEFLRVVAKAHREVEEANAVIIDLESQLQTVGVGIEVWLHRDNDTEIGYTRHGKLWHICLRGFVGDDRTGTAWVKPLLSCTSQQRIQACRALPDLANEIAAQFRERYAHHFARLKK